MKDTASRKWWTLGAVCSALFMIMIQGNIINLALPSMMADFKIDFTGAQWITNAYLLTFTMFLLTMGRLGDELGRKKIFMIGLCTYIVGAVSCGFSQSSGWLIFSSVIQGLGASAMMPATLSLIAANFEKKERGMAMGIWGAVSGLAVAVGPLAGGYITQYGMGSAINSLFNIQEYWRYIYAISAVLGLLVGLFVTLVVPESKDHEKKHHVDFFGVFLSAAAVFLLTFGLMQGSKLGWWSVRQTLNLFGVAVTPFGISPIPFIFLLAAAFGVYFVYRESKISVDPLMDMKFFKSRNFSIGTIVSMILNFVMMGSFLLLPVFIQTVLGHSSLEAGKIMLPLALTILVISPVAGMLSDRFGSQAVVAFGMLVLAAGCFYTGHFKVTTTLADLILPFIVLGLGVGLPISPINNAALYDIPVDEMGGASGLLSMIRQLGAVMGIAILGAVLSTSMIGSIERNVGGLTNVPGVIRDQIVDSAKEGKMSMMGGKKTQQMPAEYAMMFGDMETIQKSIGQAMKQSFVDSINFTFRIAGLIALFGAAAALFFQNNRGKKKKEGADHAK